MFSSDTLLLYALWCLLHQDVSSSVTRCYHCIDTCEHPPDIEECKSSSTDPTEYRCYLQSLRSDDVDSRVTAMAMCVLAEDENIIHMCFMIEAAETGRCELCDEDLCNSDSKASCLVALLFCCVLIVGIV